MLTLIMTAKLNEVDPQNRLHELLPWEWKPHTAAAKAA